ncbi:MAG TPA: hypothetical protein VFZ52_23560 [Chryseolinea sp.]
MLLVSAIFLNHLYPFKNQAGRNSPLGNLYRYELSQIKVAWEIRSFILAQILQG